MEPGPGLMNDDRAVAVGPQPAARPSGSRRCLLRCALEIGLEASSSQSRSRAAARPTAPRVARPWPRAVDLTNTVYANQ